ncbi:MAG TPA: energy transducer TonB, partial [Opitutaceae bacterium]|nr:energy transducer TonB [Opitutaceae bacterium]
MKPHPFAASVAACLILSGCSTPSSTENAPPLSSPPTTATPSLKSSDYKPPRLIRSVPPVYPLQDRRNGIEGVVLVHFVVDKAGNV